MKKLILRLVVVLLIALVINSYLKNNDTENEIVIVEVEPIHIVVPTTTPMPTPDPIEVALQEVEQKMSEIKSIEDEMEWFIAYKGIINEYSGVLDETETIYDYFTDEEIYLIQRTVETECYGADFVSKVHVANVIFNRYESDGEFGETITEIITSPNQFVYFRTDISKETILAVEYAFEIEDLTQGSIAFRSDKNPDTWHRWGYVFSDDAVHHFYR